MQLCAKFHSDEVSSIVTLKNLNLLHKTLQENNALHLRLFFQSTFYITLLFSLALNLCWSYFLLISSINHALSWSHKFTLFSHNRHDHVRIRVLLNIFSISSPSLKHFYLLSKGAFHRVFITSVILIFKGKEKNYTRWEWKTWK